MTLKYLIVFVLVLSANKIDGYNNNDKLIDGNVHEVSRSAFDDDLYESVLDEAMCEEQLVFLENDLLRLSFLDASARFPSGVRTGNLNDLGDYHQCLAINQNINNMEIQGKYCMLAVSLQEIVLPEFRALSNITWPEWRRPENETEVEKVLDLWISYDRLQRAAHVATGLNEPSNNNRMAPMLTNIILGPTFAVCIPKVCTAKQAVDFVQERLFLNITYREVYCRLPNDKPFAPADYIAFSIIGIILLLLGLSTGYDLYFTMILQQKGSPLYRSFSVYTNTKRFLTFDTYPGALECVDGIRAISMMWVIVGHTYVYTLMGYIHNLNDVFVWLRQFSSIWVNSAPITVDTFFCLSGVLCVYTTIGKINRFLDASARFPSGVRTGNLNDLGDYHQCLAINQNINNMEIQGKYCMLAVSLQEIVLPEFRALSNITWPEWRRPENETEVEKVLDLWISYDRLQRAAHVATGLNEPSNNNRMAPMLTNIILGPTFAVCIPKVCTAKQAVDFVQERLFLNITYREVYCRLPNDKPFAPADYIAFSIIGIILLLLGLSTGYDLYFTMILQQKGSPLYRSFSVYTNTKRFLTFDTYPGALECVDGIRAISMMWVIVGHTYVYTLMGYIHNLNDVFVWLRQFSSIWVNSAPITVDTFFCLSGVLCVYTTIGKINRCNPLHQIIHQYINRLLRMFPLLAAVVLLQASIFNHVSDGPYWMNVAWSVQNCRNYWWSALLHVQNFVNPSETCLVQTWYLSVDVQLYFVCPLVLICMFGSRRNAWTIVAFFTLLSLFFSSLYSFLFDFPAALFHPNRVGELQDYYNTYYVNTLARAPPFFVGMACGYLLYLWKDKEIRIPRVYAAVLWVISFILMAFCIFSIYPVMQLEHDAQVFDNFLNAYMRAIWALGLSWLIFACSKGYGGPINWFLSLSMWKLPARMSYAMYLLHFSIITVANGSWVKSHFFTNGDTLYRFGSDISFTFVFAFVLSITVDAPFSTLQKLLLGKGKRRGPVKAESQEVIVENGANDPRMRL